MAETFGCTPASVTIIPEKECPTSTVGPSCRASTRCAEATASGSVVRGFWTEVTLRPAACRRGMTSDQLDPSANNPCTRTTLRAGATAAMALADTAATAVAAIPKLSERRSIILVDPFQWEADIDKVTTVMGQSRQGEILVERR